MLWLWTPQERYVYQPEYSSFHVPGVAGPEELIASYVGLWEYQGENLWLRIREDATWEFVNDQDDVIEYGTLWVDENGLTLHFDGSGDTLQLGSISPEASLMDIDTVDPYRSLYFSLCY